MPNPAQVNDGDWSLENIETVDISYPFEDKGDFVSWEATCSFMIDKGAYRAGTPNDLFNVPNQGRGYLVSQGQPTDAGDGLYQVNRVYASLPVRRVEASTVALTVELIGKNDGDDDFSVESYTLTYAADIVYEYSLSRPDPIVAKHIFTLFGTIYVIQGNGGNVIGLPSGPTLVQDAEIGIYKGGMFYRKSIYALVPEAGRFGQ